MPADPVGAPQLHLFASHSPAYQEALAHYEAIRPILKRERRLAQHSRETGLNYWRLWRHLRRFQREGLLGLIDRRQLPHPWGKTSIEELLPRHIQQHLMQLAIAHPVTERELARIVREAYHLSVDHRGVRRMLEWHHLSPEVLKSRRQQAQQAPLPAPPPDPQLALPFEPTTLAQRLAQALGPEHLWLRWGQTVAVLVYDEAVRIEHTEHLLVSYPCVYDTARRRITAVAEHGRQQYRSFQVVPLMLWALEIMQTVWRMPPYRWAQRPRQGLRTRQLTLFDGFAE